MPGLALGLGSGTSGGDRLEGGTALARPRPVRIRSDRSHPTAPRRDALPSRQSEGGRGPSPPRFPVARKDPHRQAPQDRVQRGCVLPQGIFPRLSVRFLGPVRPGGLSAAQPRIGVFPTTPDEMSAQGSGAMLPFPLPLRLSRRRRGEHEEERFDRARGGVLAGEKDGSEAAIAARLGLQSAGRAAPCHYATPVQRCARMAHARREVRLGKGFPPLLAPRPHRYWRSCRALSMQSDRPFRAASTSPSFGRASTHPLGPTWAGGGTSARPSDSYAATMSCSSFRRSPSVVMDPILLANPAPRLQAPRSSRA